MLWIYPLERNHDETLEEGGFLLRQARMEQYAIPLDGGNRLFVNPKIRKLS